MAQKSVEIQEMFLGCDKCATNAQQSLHQQTLPTFIGCLSPIPGMTTISQQSSSLLNGCLKLAFAPFLVSQTFTHPLFGGV